MKTIYKSYSTQYKLASLMNKPFNANYNNVYYWRNKGKTKLLNSVGNKHDSQNIEDILNAKSHLEKIINELFQLFNTLPKKTLKIKQHFKNNRSLVTSLWESLKPFFDIKQICNWFNISESTYFNWKKRIVCKITVSKECPNIYPSQLRDWERRMLENDYFNNPNFFHYTLSDLYGQVIADKKIIIGESLFYKLASISGETEKRKPQRKLKKYVGLRAEKVKEIIHMDKTKFKVKNTAGAWANLICDNRSRAILSFSVSFGSHSKNTLSNLSNAIEKHNLTEQTFWLVTDDGSENKGVVTSFIKLNPKIKHKIAQKNIPYSNSMIESVIKQLKYNYLLKQEFNSIEDLINCLSIAIEAYNNRPRKLHLGKTPLQVLNGDEVDPNDYKILKKQARKERIEENRHFNCLKALYCINVN